jgi:hypothetical protein
MFWKNVVNLSKGMSLTRPSRRPPPFPRHPAQHERRLAYEYATLPGHYVDRVHPRGVYTHGDLTDTRLGDGDVGEFENLGFPELILLMTCIVSIMPCS